MALRNLEVVVTVTDRASRDLDKVSRKVRQTGKAAKEANTDFTAFNRTLFATTAFVGTFIKAFSSLSRAFEEGAQLDRISNQFERLFGPKAHLTGMISNFTDTFVDEMEFMKQAVALRSMGIVTNVDQVTELFTRASVAAKMAGKTSAEGIQHMAEFLKDSNVSHLQHLNLIQQTNVGLQMQNKVLSQFGGIAGGVLSQQARLALGQRLLFMRTKDAMKGNRDLTDTLSFAKQQFSLFRGEVGRFLLTAMQPLIESFALFINKARIFIDQIRGNEKNLLFLAKAAIVTTSSILGLAGALGTLRLASIALASLGLGLPRLIGLIGLLGASFLGITSKADTVIDKLRVFGAFVKGVYQLVTTLDTKTGIAKIDEDIRKLLEENGILIFAQNVARAISVVKTVVGDMIDAFRFFAGRVDALFGGLGKKFIDMISKFKEPWENFWVSEAATPMQKFMRTFTVMGSTFATVFTGLFIKALFSKLGGVLSKIPILGKLFGGGRDGGGPKGTRSDPMYIKDVDKGMTAGVGLLQKFSPSAVLDTAIAFLKRQIVQLALVFELGGGGISGAITLIRTVLTSAVQKFAIVGTMVAAIMGSIQGIIETSDEWGKFFSGLTNLAKAVFDVTANFVQNNEFLKAVGEAIVKVASGIYDTAKFIVVDIPMKLFNLIKEGWKNIFGWMGIGAGKLGETMDSLAKQISPDTFKKPDFGKALEMNKMQAPVAAMNTASQPGDKTTATLPTGMSQEETVDVLGEHLKTLSGSQRKQAQSAIEAALKSDSEGGRAITAEEMEAILRSGQTKEVSLLERIANNTEPIRGSGAVPSRR